MQPVNIVPPAPPPRFKVASSLALSALQAQASASESEQPQCRPHYPVIYHQAKAQVNL